MPDVCVACGKCCKKHWLLRLTNNLEKAMFKESLIYGNFIWTDECRFLSKDGKCKNHGAFQPQRCKEYFCEGKEIN